jgi:oligosaccharide repeat unit polymerase
MLLMAALSVYMFSLSKEISQANSFGILVISIMIGFWQIVKKSKRQSFDFFTNGNAWLLLGIFLIFVAAPLSLSYSSVSLPKVFAIRDWQTFYPFVNLYAAMAVLALSAGHAIKLGDPRVVKETVIPTFTRQIYPIAILATLFWLTYYALWVRTQGGISAAVFANRAQFRAAGASSNNGYGVDAIYGALGALCVLIVVTQKNKPSVHRFFILFYLILLIPSIFNGSRSKFVFYLVVLLILKISLGLKITKVQFMVGFLLVPLLIVAPRLYRFDSTGLSSSSIYQSYNLTNILETLTQEDLAMAPALSILELNRQNDRIPKLYGSSYLGALVKPIPRALFPAKPIEFDKKLNSIVFPVESKNVGLSFSALSEPLVNFGPIGIVLFFFFLGNLNSRLRFRRKLLGSLNSILIHAWVTGFMFVLIRGNLSVDYQRVLFPLGTALLILKISSIIQSRSAKSMY